MQYNGEFLNVKALSRLTGISTRILLRRIQNGIQMPDLTLPPFNDVWWTNGTDNKFQHECPGVEWRRGRTRKHTPETLAKMSVAAKGKKHWTNGEVNTRVNESPGPEWRRGMTK